MIDWEVFTPAPVDRTVTLKFTEAEFKALRNAIGYYPLDHICKLYAPNRSQICRLFDELNKVKL